MSHSHRFSVAPMMDCTDRHCRRLLRLISRRARLYTEMVTAAAIVHGRDPSRLLAFDPVEEPLTLQLGGSDPELLARAAVTARDLGYTEINLNVGCPSDRVTVGRFGACLMAEPALVASCVTAIADATQLPVTVKCRIGIDDQDPEQGLDTFVTTVAAAGCQLFVVHARKAWLQGLSPKENREIPPLDYDRVRRLKRSHPSLTIVLNGGLKTLPAAQAALGGDPSVALDGVMLGRAVYDDPFLLEGVDRAFFEETRPAPERLAVVEAYLAYAAAEIAAGTRPSQLLRHLVGLFRGGPGARAWRQAVTQTMRGDRTLADLGRVAERVPVAEPLAA